MSGGRCGRGDGRAGGEEELESKGGGEKRLARGEDMDQTRQERGKGN